MPTPSTMVNRLSPVQQQALYRDGYVVLPGVVPAALVNAVRRLIHLNIGRLWLRAHATNDPASSGDLARLKRAVEIEAATQFDPAVLALLTDTPLKLILEHALGAPIHQERGAQLATLFPSRPNNYVNESGYRDCDTPFHGWHGHLDGLWNGATPMHQDITTPMSAEAFAQWSASPSGNGQARTFPEHGANIANFTALLGIALSDQRESGSGNLGVLAGAHHAMAKFFQFQRDSGGPLGPDGPDWARIDHDAPNRCGLRHYPAAVRAAFAANAAHTADGKLWPKPTLLHLAPGDAVIALHCLPHSATRVEGPDPRLMAYFRITSSARPAANGRVYPDALCNPWIEWRGLPGVG